MDTVDTGYNIGFQGLFAQPIWPDCQVSYSITSIIEEELEKSAQNLLY